MRLLELFCGTKSVGKVFQEHGWEVCSVDIESKFHPSIVADVLTLPTTIGIGFDYIHMSPPCTEFSISHTGSKRNIDSANILVKHCLAITRDSNPKFWTLENPHSGLLKKQDFMQGLNFTVASYCKYGFPYRKNTCFWNNFDLNLSKCAYDCASIYKYTSPLGKTHLRHLTSAQKGPCHEQDVCYKSTELYRIPENLVEEIHDAIMHSVETPAPSVT